MTITIPTDSMTTAVTAMTRERCVSLKFAHQAERPLHGRPYLLWAQLRIAPLLLGCKAEDTRLGLEWSAVPPIAYADGDGDSDILQTDFLKMH